MELEREAGREPADTRYRGASADVESDGRLIEVKAFGRSARGEFLWLEPVQVQTARSEPERFFVYVVENVGQGDPAEFRLRVFGGEQLQRLIARAREKHYYEVP